MIISCSFELFCCSAWSKCPACGQIALIAGVRFNGLKRVEKWKLSCQTGLSILMALIWHTFTHQKAKVRGNFADKVKYKLDRPDLFWICGFLTNNLFNNCKNAGNIII